LVSEESDPSRLEFALCQIPAKKERKNGKKEEKRKEKKTKRKENEKKKRNSETATYGISVVSEA